MAVSAAGLGPHRPGDAPGGASLAERVHAVLTGEDALERACRDIPESECTAQPRNFLLNLANGACSKLAEQIVHPGLVLAWLLGAIGAPAALIGLLMPIRQSGALLPQLAVAARVRGLERRKGVWVSAGLLQAACLGAMLPAVLLLPPASAGIAVVLLLAVFSIASGVGSLAFQDVTAKTVPKGRRGRLLALRASFGGGLALVAMLLLRLQTGPEAGLAPLLWLIAAGALLWALASLCFALISERAGATEGGRSTWHEAQAAFVLVRRVAAYRRYLLVRALLLSVEIAMPFFVLHAQAVYGEAASLLIVFLVAVGLANVVSSPVWGRLADERSSRVLALGGGLGTLAALVALAGAAADAPAWTYSFSLFLLGLAEAGVRLGRKTYLVDAAPDADRPAYVAFANTTIGLLALAAGTLGVVADVAGPAWLLAGVAALAGLGGLAALGLPDPDRFLAQARA